MAFIVWLRETMEFTFSIETVVQGYHIYKEIWNAVMDGTELPYEREICNANNSFAIAIKKVTPTAGNVTVGHTLEQFHQFLRFLFVEVGL